MAGSSNIIQSTMQRLLCFIFLIKLGASHPYSLHDHYDSSHHHHNIHRPCSIHDMNCIRQFFVHNFGCTPAYDSADDSYVVTRTVEMNIPHANLTSRRNHFQIMGLNSGTIQEFYIDKETDTLVLEVEFGDLHTYTPKVVFSYLRRGREPIETSDFVKARYRNLSLTLTLRHYRDIKLADSHVFVHLSELPQSQYGPGILYPYVKGLSANRLNSLQNFELTAREGVADLGPVFMRAFLRTRICSLRH